MLGLHHTLVAVMFEFPNCSNPHAVVLHVQLTLSLAARDVAHFVANINYVKKFI